MKEPRSNNINFISLYWLIQSLFDIIDGSQLYIKRLSNKTMNAKDEVS